MAYSTEKFSPSREVKKLIFGLKNLKHIWLLLSITFLLCGVIGVLLLPSGESQGKSTTPMALPAASPPVQNQAKTIIVDAQRMWTDCSIQIRKGDLIKIEASGQVNACTAPGDGANKWVGPDGWGYQPEFNIAGVRTDWVHVLGRGTSLECLTGKIGKKGMPFKVGRYSRFTAQEAGVLYLGVNHVISDYQGHIIHSLDEEGVIWPGSAGSFSATVQIEP